jgi:S1-C subfamily serine protease
MEPVESGQPTSADAAPAIPPELSSSITSDPPRPALALSDPPVETSKPDAVNVRRGTRDHGRLSSSLLSVAVFLSVVLLALYAAPALLYRWRTAEAQADAESAYLRRQAELRAEAEAADKRLDLLDKRVNLVSLGFREVARKVAPHVVNVANLRAARQGEAGLLGKRTLYHDPVSDRTYVETAVGSGVLVKPGYLLTNEHVVRGAQELRLTFASGQPLMVDARRVTADPMTDLAIIHLPDDLPEMVRAQADVTTEFADSDKTVQVGDWVLAVGSPLGLKQTVTHGVISAKGRLLHLLDLVELIQTDASINPGNSGGPLFDQLGRVAGINVAIASDNGGNQGIGFAIPSNTARQVFEQLATKGEVIRGFAGVVLGEVSRARLKALGIKEETGVVVQDVLPEEAGGKAGLKAGDIVVRFNREPLSPVNPVRQLRQWIFDTAPGTEVSLEIVRHGARQTLAMTVGKRPALAP